MEWILIFWVLMDRGGGPAAVEFTSKERCEEAARAIFDSKRDPTARWSKMQGNFVCVQK